MYLKNVDVQFEVKEFSFPRSIISVFPKENFQRKKSENIFGSAVMIYLCLLLYLEKRLPKIRY